MVRAQKHRDNSHAVELISANNKRGEGSATDNSLIYNLLDRSGMQSLGRPNACKMWVNLYQGSLRTPTA